MCDIPEAVGDPEKVVRAVFSNHLKKNKLQKVIFQPSPGTDDVSVMRHAYLGSDACKAAALEKIQQGNPNLKYKGFVVIIVAAVRSTGSDVIDSRVEFCGHAHISHGFQVPPEGEPLHAELKIKLDDRIRELKELAHFVADPDPASATWTGAAL
jgi:hypothetical protein